MVQAAFQHRSGRVIALGRLVLAAAFLLAIWLDPSQPSLRPELAYGLLALYVLWSAAMLLATWRNWWLDFRLAALAHLVDIAAFGTLVFFTEGYTSPFYTFFMFLLLSAAIRWSWRETALTAVAVLALFVTAGSASLAIGTGEFDLQRLLIRSTHLVVLSLLFIWFGINQPNLFAGAGAGEPEPRPDADGPPVEPALRRAAERMRAQRMVFAWSQQEEPWVNVATLDGEGFRSERVGPETYGPLLTEPAGDLPFLFDWKSGRALRRSRREPHRRHGFRQAIDPDFATRHRLDEGVAIRVRARDYEGELFALGIGGLCGDDLREAEILGQEISALFDRSSIVAVSEEAAVARARASLARDLHDSVVQALAGASFRLEALKSWIRAGQDPAPEIDAVKAELAIEQSNVRAFIAGLRGGRGTARHADLTRELADVAEQIRRRWSLTCGIDGGDSAIEGPAWLAHEVSQIVREAAANAARHGGATALAVTLRREGGGLELIIADNGRGFPTDGDGGDGEGPVSPWSVHERVKALDGTLSLSSGGEGSRLKIRLPLENGG